MGTDSTDGMLLGLDDSGLSNGKKRSAQTMRRPLNITRAGAGYELRKKDGICPSQQKSDSRKLT
jgi:hypothetical protein